jgi:hypothetical protein
MKNFFNFKALVLSFVMAMLCVVPVSAQQSDDFFRVDDDTYSNRDVVGMIWATGGFTPADPEAPIGSGLLIMVAAGAGYVVVRRRRSIRKGTTLLLAFAILLGLTQCKKKVDTINAVVTNGIPMTLEAYNGGRTSVSDEGIINWTAGDKIYVVCDGECVGYVENTAGALTTFTGTVTGVTTGAHTFHYYYVGNQTIADAATSFEMDFSDQTGNLDDLGDFHVGHGSQEISYTAGDEISAAAEMTSLVSVGYFDIAGMAEVGEKVFMYGENVNNKISINFSTNVVTNTKVDTEHNNNYISLGIVSDGATCGRYVMLVPNDGTETTISFVSKRTSGSYTFPRGIETGKFYCKNDNTSTPLTISPVAYTPGSLRGEFTINNSGDKVHFSQGNLKCTRETAPWGTNPSNWDWGFMDRQYDIVETADVSVDYSEEDVVSLFGWGCTGFKDTDYYGDQEHYLPNDTYGAEDYVYGPSGNYYLSVNRKSDWGITMGDGWHTFSEAEISYMLGRYDHKLTIVNGIEGLMVLNSVKVTPSIIKDEYNLNAWQLLEAEGAVFFPTAGFRDYDYDDYQGNVVVRDVRKIGYYWTASYDTEDEDADYAYQLQIEDGLGSEGLDDYQTSRTFRSQGLSVRLVRDVE